jgi:hypothetical protein
MGQFLSKLVGSTSRKPPPTEALSHPESTITGLRQEPEREPQKSLWHELQGPWAQFWGKGPELKVPEPPGN